MAASFGNIYTFHATVAQLGAIVRDSRFWVSMGFAFKGEMPMGNGVRFYFSTSTSFTSWGENIEIGISPVNENTSQVTIRSECNMITQIVDWGKNKNNVENVYGYLSIHAANGARPQSGSAGRYCPQCGNPAEAEGNFCMRCGAKLQ